MWCACASTGRSGQFITGDLDTCSDGEEEELLGCCYRQSSLHWSVWPAGKCHPGICCVHVHMCVHLHLEYLLSLNWEVANRQERRNPLGLKVLWAQLLFPRAHTAFSHTGSSELFPFHGSIAVQAPIAQKSNDCQLLSGFYCGKLGFGLLFCGSGVW